MDPTTTALHIRHATADDAASIHAMVVALAADTGHAERISSIPRDFVTYGFGEKKRFTALIAERDTDAVGLCLFFFTYSSWLGEPGVYVQDLYIDTAERGRGTGRRLLAATAAYGARHDATHLRLSVDGANEAAQRFYRRVGMQYRDEERSFHIGNEAFNDLSREQPCA